MTCNVSSFCHLLSHTIWYARIIPSSRVRAFNDHRAQYNIIQGKQKPWSNDEYKKATNKLIVAERAATILAFAFKENVMAAQVQKQNKKRLKIGLKKRLKRTKQHRKQHATSICLDSVFCVLFLSSSSFYLGRRCAQPARARGTLSEMFAKRPALPLS